MYFIDSADEVMCVVVLLTLSASRLKDRCEPSFLCLSHPPAPLAPPPPHSSSSPTVLSYLSSTPLHSSPLLSLSLSLPLSLSLTKALAGIYIDIGAVQDKTGSTKTEGLDTYKLHAYVPANPGVERQRTATRELSLLYICTCVFV